MCTLRASGTDFDVDAFLSDSPFDPERFVFDFPVELRADGVEVVAQYDRFPASLVARAGSLGFGLELSRYAVSREAEEA